VHRRNCRAELARTPSRWMGQSSPERICGAGAELARARCQAAAPGAERGGEEEGVRRRQQLLMTLAKPTLVAAAIVDLGLSSSISVHTAPFASPFRLSAPREPALSAHPPLGVHLWPHRRLPDGQRWSSRLVESRVAP
jgi:hypothetical protein